MSESQPEGKDSPLTRESTPPQARPSTSQESGSPPPSETDKQPSDDSWDTAGPSQPKQESGSPPPSETDERPPEDSSGTPGPSQPQQAGAAPEDVWMSFILSVFPNLLCQTHYIPPIHFSRTSQVVATIAGQTVSVRDNPISPPKRRGKKPSHPPPAQVAGTVFVENPCNLEAAHIQDSDQQDDRAQQRCLQALSHIPNEVMMVISSFLFQKYLNNNALHAAAISQLPTIQHPSIPQQTADAECDIVVIHRQYGLIVGEIKSVGESSFFCSQDPGAQTQLITKQVEKALKQLNNQETGLRHLVSDLPSVRITKTLLLPNISSVQLQSALSASPLLLQNLCQSLAIPSDVSLAVGHCLLEQDARQPLTWWQTLTTAGRDPVMTDDLYKRLAARFCGPATTVEVPTAGPSYKVVKSWGQAVAETGLRFSTLSLTPAQATLLNRQPQPQWMHLEGPPGTGKTVLLLLKALQSVRQGGKVVIVSGDVRSRAVTLLLEEQLRSIVGPAAATSIQRLCYDFRDRRFDARAAVCSLQQQVGPGPVLVIFDEVDIDYRRTYLRWLTEVHAQLPSVSVWAAGCHSLNRILTDPLPSWLEVQTLQEALRCPPTVTTHLQRSFGMKARTIPPYRAPQHLPARSIPPYRAPQHLPARSIPPYRAPQHLPARSILPYRAPQHLPARSMPPYRAPQHLPARSISSYRAPQHLPARTIPPYRAPQHLPATQGPPVQRLHHDGQPGHSGDYPWQCVTCSDLVADIISQLRVGQPGHPLQYRDVWILYHRDVPSANDVMVRRLQQHHGLPVGVVTSHPPSQADVRELALAVRDQVIAVHWEAVVGLERRVVIVLRGRGLFYANFIPPSRCSSSLHLID